MQGLKLNLNKTQQHNAIKFCLLEIQPKAKMEGLELRPGYILTNQTHIKGNQLWQYYFRQCSI
jgi:hypothetical protein